MAPAAAPVGADWKSVMAALFRSGTMELAHPVKAPIATIDTTERVRLRRRTVCMSDMA
jgi:hypothetical protein